MYDLQRQRVLPMVVEKRTQTCTIGEVSTLTKNRIAVVVGAAAALAAFPAGASAQSGVQTLEGQASSTLSLTVPLTASASTELKQGQSSTFSPTAIAVVDPLGTWTLKVKDTTSNPGQLKKDAADTDCDNSDTTIGAALTYVGDAVVGGNGSGTLGSSDTTVASGDELNLLDTVNVTFTQPTVSSTALLAGGCTYKTTATYTLF